MIISSGVEELYIISLNIFAIIVRYEIALIEYQHPVHLRKLTTPKPASGKMEIKVVTSYNAIVTL